MALHRARVDPPDTIPLDEVQQFQRFFEGHQRGVFSLLVHLGVNEARAGDLTQQVFVRIWQMRHVFRGDDERAVACYRQALVWGRAAAERPTGTIRRGQVLRTLQELPEEERAAVVLSTVARMPSEQIARVLRDPEWRVRRLLQRAWGRLTAALSRGRNESE